MVAAAADLAQVAHPIAEAININYNNSNNNNNNNNNNKASVAAKAKAAEEVLQEQEKEGVVGRLHQNATDIWMDQYISRQSTEFKARATNISESR